MGLILASASTIRRSMLENAGVPFQMVRSSIDESVEKARHSQSEPLARALAEAKAVAVSIGRDRDWVIGSDSVIRAAGRFFDKPANREEAAAHLRLFSGNTLELTSAVALVRDGTAQWSHCETARLDVRPLSEGFIQSYLDAEWPEVGYCVGVFRLEGPGVQLFDRIDGSFFTILGMPLLPLLGALRERGVLQS